MRRDPAEREIYRHFKGNLYQIVTLAKHSETGEEMVVYRALYGEGETFVRPLDMFMEELDPAKYPDATQKYRFEKMDAVIDPGVEEFLDATEYEDKIRILTHIRSRVTDDMINIMAISLDLDIKDGKLEDRLDELFNCLSMRARFETGRLRS
ncbi:MAG: DUF1653 domain-containing protein [Lachnospiraceae bacterium]|nr:DUF1653 domain-containing protein [Lachnospiraceae bacterium]